MFPSANLLKWRVTGSFLYRLLIVNNEGGGLLFVVTCFTTALKFCFVARTKFIFFLN